MGQSTPRHMQDSLLTAALILLIIAHGILIRSCYSLHTQIPAESTEVKTRLDGVSTLLDEALDMIAEVVPGKFGSSPQPSPFEASPGGILGTLISSMMMPPKHGNAQEPENWEVLPPDEEAEHPTTTNQTQPSGPAGDYR